MCKQYVPPRFLSAHQHQRRGPRYEATYRPTQHNSVPRQGCVLSSQLPPSMIEQLVINHKRQVYPFGCRSREETDILFSIWASIYTAMLLQLEQLTIPGHLLESGERMGDDLNQNHDQTKQSSQHHHHQDKHHKTNSLYYTWTRHDAAALRQNNVQVIFSDCRALKTFTQQNNW